MSPSMQNLKSVAREMAELLQFKDLKKLPKMSKNYRRPLLRLVSNNDAFKSQQWCFAE